MVLVIAGIAVVVAFLLLSQRALTGDPPARGVAGILAGLLAPFALFAAFASLVLAAMRCDESCTGEGWIHTADAWQWPALFITALIGSMLVVAALVQTTRRRHRRAQCSMLAAACLFGGWTVL